MTVLYITAKLVLPPRAASKDAKSERREDEEVLRAVSQSESTACVFVCECVCMFDAQREQSHLSVSARAGARAVLLPAPLPCGVSESSAHSLDFCDGNVTHLIERGKKIINKIIK